MDNAQQVALEARGRAFGLTPIQSAAMPETTVLGALKALGGVSQRQYDAGSRYRAICGDYDRAMLARGLPSPGDLDRTRSHDGADGTDPAYIERCRRAINRWDECERALTEANRIDRLASVAVKYVVLDGVDRRDLLPHLVAGLDALALSLQLPN